MNCLQIISGRGPTGAAAAAMADARALRTVGGRVFAACKTGIDPNPNRIALEEAGVPRDEQFFDFTFPRGAGGLLQLPRDAKRLARLVSTEKIEIVHVHRTDEQWLAAFALRDELGRKLIRTWHRDPLNVSRSLLKILVGNAAGFVCVSREHERALKAAGAQNARFVHGAVDTDFFLPKLDRQSGPIIIGQAARWKIEGGEDRGQRFALKIFSQLPKDLNWQGVLLGRGEIEGMLREEAFDKLRLPPERVRIVNTQKMTAREFADQLSAFDLGLVFNTGSDGASRPALEMLSSGVPLMVAERPGLVELAEHESVLKCAGGTDAWAAAVTALLGNTSQMSAMKTSARQQALSVHSFKSRGEALLEFYRQCAL